MIGTATLGIVVEVHLAAAALGIGRVIVLGVRGVVHALCQRRQQVDISGGPESYSCAHWPIYVTGWLFVCSLANLCFPGEVGESICGFGSISADETVWMKRVTACVHAFVLARVCVRSYLRALHIVYFIVGIFLCTIDTERTINKHSRKVSPDVCVTQNMARVRTMHVRTPVVAILR